MFVPNHQIHTCKHDARYSISLAFLIIICSCAFVHDYLILNLSVANYDQDNDQTTTKIYAKLSQNVYIGFYTFFQITYNYLDLELFFSHLIIQVTV